MESTANINPLESPYGESIAKGIYRARLTAVKASTWPSYENKEITEPAVQFVFLAKTPTGTKELSRKTSCKLGANSGFVKQLKQLDAGLDMTIFNSRDKAWAHAQSLVGSYYTLQIDVNEKGYNTIVSVMPEAVHRPGTPEATKQAPPINGANPKADSRQIDWVEESQSAGKVQDDDDIQF